MVLGLLLGSAIQALLPVNWVARVLGRTGFGSAVAGGLLAIPGMMCTCCAAPVVVGLRERQAAPGAAIAFWLGNSVLNPATPGLHGFRSRLELDRPAARARAPDGVRGSAIW